MHLAILIRDLGLAGAQRQAVALACGVARREGMKASVVCFYGGPFEDELRAAGVNVVRLEKRGRWDMLGFAWRVLMALRELRADVLYCYMAEANLLGTLLRPLLPGRPFLAWGMRDSGSDAATYGWLAELVFDLGTWLSRTPDVIIANSHAGARYYIELGYPAETMRVVWNGVRSVGRGGAGGGGIRDKGKGIRPELLSEETAGAVASEAETLVNLPVLGDPGLIPYPLSLIPEPSAQLRPALRFTAIGRLTSMKDYPTLLRAMDRLPGERATLRIVGSGPAEYRAGLVRLAGELGLAERVQFEEARPGVAEVFAQTDVLVSSSSQSEGFSNVVGEAMLAAKPCIVTDVGDAALIVGDTGLVCPPKDVAALAAAMQCCLEMSREELLSLGEKARARALAEFGVERMVEETLGKFEIRNSKFEGGRASAGELARRGGGTALTERAEAELYASLAPSNFELRISNFPTPLVFITTALGTGGAEMMLAQLIGSLDRRRFEPVVISMVDGGKHAEALAAAGVAVHGLGMAAGRPSLRSLWRLVKLVRALRPGLLVGWMYHGCLAATLASWCGGQVPVLWNIRQSLYSLALEKRGSALVIRLLAWLSGSGSLRRIVYNSAVSAAQHEALGYAKAKSLLLPNGFDATRFAPSLEARQTVRAELGLSTEALLVGRFGRASAMKDYPCFDEAMRSVSAQGIAAGSGVAELPSGKVKHLGERDDMARLTAALDVAVSSSAFGEGFPNVVAEAMACAVPCVVTDVGDSAWVLGDAGKVVPARDAEALSQAIRQLLALPAAERHAIGQRGRERILREFALTAVVRRFEDLFDTTLGRTPAEHGAEPHPSSSLSTP